MSNDRYLTRTEAMDYLGVGRTVLKRLTDEHLVVWYTINKRGDLQYSQKSLDEYREKQKFGVGQFAA